MITTHPFFYARRRIERKKGEKKDSFRELNSRLYISTCIIIQPSTDTRSLESFRLGYPPQIPLSNSFYSFLHDPYLILHHHLYSTFVTISNHHQHICPLGMCFLSSGLLLFHIQHPSHPNSMYIFFPFFKGCYITYSILSRAYTLGIQIPSLCRYDPHHNICGQHSLNTLCLLDMSLKKYTFLPSFYDTWFFDIIASMLTHIPCHKSSSFWSLSFLVPFSLSFCQSICYHLSISFFCTPYILTYQPIIDIYGFANFSFF